MIAHFQICGITLLLQGDRKELLEVCSTSYVGIAVEVSKARPFVSFPEAVSKLGRFGIRTLVGGDASHKSAIIVCWSLLT